MNIELNEAEQRLAHYLAKKRYMNARNKGVHNAKMGDQSDELTDLEGIAAEIAWCKANNVFPDTTIAEKLPTFDAIARTGERIDVKSTTYRNGHLLAVRWKGVGEVDVYCLVVGKFPVYCIAGYMDAADLLDESMLKDLGRGKGYAASQSELRKTISA